MMNCFTMDAFRYIERYPMGNKTIHPIQEVDGIRFYSKPEGYFKADYIRYGGITIHRYVWEKYHGEIPAGFHIHHKDHDKANNAIENLELIKASEHSKEHAAIRKEQGWKHPNMQPALSAAREWHQSEAGLLWHQAHGKTTWVGREKTTYVCRHCTKPYEGLVGSRKSGSGFCSNNCRAYWRKASGIDNIELACPVCQKNYTTHKYSRAKYCSKTCSTKGKIKC